MKSTWPISSSVPAIRDCLLDFNINNLSIPAARLTSAMSGVPIIAYADDYTVRASHGVSEYFSPPTHVSGLATERLDANLNSRLKHVTACPRRKPLATSKSIPPQGATTVTGSLGRRWTRR